MSKKNLVVKRVFDFFVSSPDYNGIPLTRLSDECEIEYHSMIDIVKELVQAELVTIQNDINPHIISIGIYTLEHQLNLLENAKQNKTETEAELPGIRITSESHLLCVYPTRKYLEATRDMHNFTHRPYSRELALGEPQLDLRFFEIDVLERYFRDPRFSFSFKDYSGQISYEVDENQNPLVKEGDQLFLKTFGLGFDSEQNRLAVVFLRYLNDLTPEHQQFWKSKEVNEGCSVYNEYYTNALQGRWITTHSVFTAFVEEQKAINSITQYVFNAKLFNKAFGMENRPKEFSFFFIPTLENYNAFILLLDKMISDNLNKQFFVTQGMQTNEIIKDHEGTSIKKDKGTLRLLEEWLVENVHYSGSMTIQECLQIFKDIRKERQSPAHKISENFFDKSLVQKQKDVIRNAYYSMRFLRLMIQLHPGSKAVEIPKWLDSGEIKVF